MRIITIIIASFLLINCKNEEKTKNIYFPTKEETAQMNKEWIEEEHQIINQFVERKEWKMEKSTSGLRYLIYKKGTGKKPTAGMKAMVSYSISLLDGREIYNTKETGPQPFLVERDDIETGVHEAITYMKVGDRAKVIIPPYLGHGLMGDNSIIPPRATLLFDLKLLGVSE